MTPDVDLYTRRLSDPGRDADGYRCTAAVAHDLNNQMTIIIACSELLLDQIGRTDAMCEDLLEIRAAAQKAASLAREVAPRR